MTGRALKLTLSRPLCHVRSRRRSGVLTAAATTSRSAWRVTFPTPPRNDQLPQTTLAGRRRRCWRRHRQEREGSEGGGDRGGEEVIKSKRKRAARVGGVCETTKQMCFVSCSFLVWSKTSFNPPVVFWPKFNLILFIYLCFECDKLKAREERKERKQCNNNARQFP